MKRIPWYIRLVYRMDWYVMLLLWIIAGIGCMMLLAAAGGEWRPWALNHLIRFGGGCVVMGLMAGIPTRIWYKAAYPFYILTLGLLAAVDIVGAVKKGAERWIDLGFMQLQPSEIAKISLILVLARFFHDGIKARMTPLLSISIPLILILLPVALILAQPDLGTAILLLGGGASIMFFAGVPWWFFASGLALTGGLASVIWQNLHDYQKSRITIFLNPETDPLGKGYHILQSKIAMGAGGFWGRGFMQGTQSQLDFLPEKHTDFAFTAFAEQFGFVGTLTLLGLFMLLIWRMLGLGLGCEHWFGKLLILGLCMNLFFHIFVNMAMVMGLLPVVGIPLPFFSYGGTSMLSLLFGFGLVMSVKHSKEV